MSLPRITAVENTGFPDSRAAGCILDQREHFARLGERAGKRLFAGDARSGALAAVDGSRA
jgi:hypothetical protein